MVASLLLLLAPASFIFSVAPKTIAQSLSQSDLDAIYDWPNWVPTTAATPPECTTTSTNPVGGGPLYGLTFPEISNTQDLINNINSFATGTPFAGMGQEFVQYGQQYNVNPALVVGIAWKETNLGTAKGVKGDTNDAFGLTGPFSFNGVQYPVNSYDFVIFSSFEAGIQPINYYISSAYLTPGTPRYSTTVLEMMVNGYTPTGVNAQGTGGAQIAADATLDVMSKLFDGIALDPSAKPTPDTTVTDPCTGQTTPVTSAGAYGWDMSGPNAMITYNMEVEPWLSDPYPGVAGDTIGSAGCGPTSIAMVVATLTGNSTITPAIIADRYGPEYHDSDGTEWGIFPVIAQDYGLHDIGLGTDLSAAAQILEQGGLVIISVGPGVFTSGRCPVCGHFMVIRAVTPDGGNFYLNNPDSYPPYPGTGNDDVIAYSASFLQNADQGHMTQLWGFTK
jgi:hypothetical protein